MLFDDFRGGIGGVIVNDEHLDRSFRQLLPFQGTKGIIEIPGTVVRAYNKCDLRLVVHYAAVICIIVKLENTFFTANYANFDITANNPLMKEKPLVSAIVTTHNRPALLPRALDSVAVQSYSSIELVVVDDGSEEDVAPVVEGYRKAVPVRFLRNSKPAGACRARNRGIEAASGVFVAGLDDDDAWTEHRVEKLMEAYSDQYAFVTSDVRMVYKNRSAVWRKSAEITLDDLLYSNYVGNQGLIRRERLLAVGGFDETLEAAQDYDLWIRLAEQFGPVKNVREPLQDIHMEHSGRRISNPRDQLRGYLNFYRKHRSKMNRSQRKYQLYNIRKATGKVTGLADLIGWVPPHRYWKEIKNLIAGEILEQES